MKRSFWICLIILAAGFLPDSDKRLFSLNRDHGPSLPDAIGIVTLVATFKK